MYLKIKLFIIFFLTLLSFSLQAQIDTTKAFSFDEEESVGVFSLEDCILYAFDNLERIKRIRLDVKNAQAQIIEYRSVGLPQVYADFTFIDNVIIQKSILPDGTLFGGPPGPIAVAFQPQFTANGNITINQQLYNPTYIAGLKALKLYTRFIEKQGQITKIDVAEAVAKAYFNVLVSKERLKLLEANLNRLDSLLQDTKKLQVNGFVELIDVNRTEVSFNNLAIDVENTKQLIQLTINLLKFQMGMPVEQKIDIKGKLSEYTIDERIFQDTLNKNPDDRVEYEVLKQQRVLLEIDLLNKKRVSYTPSLNAFASGGYNTGNNDLKGLTNGYRYFQFGNFGLDLRIPIMSGFKNNALVSKAKIELDKNSLDVQSFQKTYDFQVQKAVIELQNNLNTLKARKKNMALALDVSKQAKIKYDNGVGSNLEVITAETTYKETEIAYYEALYNTLVSRVDFEKALGILIK